MANLAMHDPFQDMRSFMRRAFDDRRPSWFDDYGAAARGESGARVRALTLPLDVFESEDGLTVQAPVPGFSKDEVEVTLQKGQLTIRADKKGEHEEKHEEDGRTYFLRERSHGASSRSLLIGESYDPNSVEGALKDGVLTLSVKKAPEAQPKRVAISG